MWNRCTRRRPSSPFISPTHELGYAAKLGLKDGDAIWIESPYAKAKATVQVTEWIHPEVVGLHHGYGHWGFGSNIHWKYVPSILHI